MTAPPRPPRAGPDGIDYHIGVVRQAGGIILTRQAGGNGVMTALPQFPLHQVPIPADIAAAMDQRKRGHHHLRLEQVIITYRRYQHGKEKSDVHTLARAQNTPYGVRSIGVSRS